MSKLLVTIDNNDFTVELSGVPNPDGTYTVVIDGTPVTVAIPCPDSPDAIDWAVVDHRPYELQIDNSLHSLQSPRGRHIIHVRDLEATSLHPISGDGRIKAPIPGKIVRILTEAGQTVEVGQPLLVLEAMKMENEITAPRAGTLSSLNVHVGQGVQLHEILGEIS